MAQEKKLCSHQDCSQELYQDSNYPTTDKCIFHAEQKDPLLFRTALTKQILLWRKEKKQYWDFRGFVFIDREIRPNLFRNSVFPVSTDFEGASFKCSAIFESALFRHHVSFQSVIFAGTLDFRYTVFNKDANFRNVVLRYDADFSYASFLTYGDFLNCRIQGHVRFKWPGEGICRRNNKEVEPGTLQFDSPDIPEGCYLDLSNNSLAANCRLAIMNCNDMRRILLVGTDCTKIEFYNDQWVRIKGRLVVGDEYVASKESQVLKGVAVDWGRIAITYEQLSKRYHDYYDYFRSNSFRNGYFEMRKRAEYVNGGLSGIANNVLITLYKVFSGYSSNLFRPIFWLLSFICIIFPLIYAATKPVNTSISWLQNVEWLLHDSVKVSFLIRGDLWILDITDLWIVILVALQRIVTFTLIALIILVIRRRFRREA